MRHGRIVLRVATLNNPGKGDALYRRAPPFGNLQAFEKA